MKKNLILTSLAALVATTAANAADGVSLQDVVDNAKMAVAEMPSYDEPQYGDYKYDSTGDGEKDSSLVDGAEVIDSTSEVFTYQNRKGDWADLTLATATGTAQANQEINPEDYYYASATAGITYYGDDEDIDPSKYEYSVKDMEGNESTTNLAETTDISTDAYTYAVNAQFTTRTTPQTVAHEPVYSDYVGLDSSLENKTLADFMLADGSDLDGSKLSALDDAAKTSVQNAYAAYNTDHAAYEAVKVFYDYSVAKRDEIKNKADADRAVVIGMNGVYKVDLEDYNAKHEAYDNALASLADAQAEYTTAHNAYVDGVTNATDYANSLSKVINDADAVTLVSAKAYADDSATDAKAYADGKISDEAATRAQKDSELAQAISDEATTRAQKDDELAQAISDEATARVNADKQLQKQINENIANSSANTLSSAMAYTDKKVDELEKDVSGGVASAVALSSVAVSNVNKGEVSVGGGYGYYNGQSAVAFGAAMGLTDRWSVNAGAGIASGNDTQVSFRAGTNYKFKLF